MSKMKHLLTNLNSELSEYTPIPFWFLNDRLEKEELRRQLLDFKTKGIDGVVLHPRMGVPKSLEYLSEEYFTIIHYIVETAQELNMKIVLYDEGMYPSGSAHGEVVRQNPEYASMGITLVENPMDGILLAGPRNGKYLVAKYCGGTIRGIHYGEDDGDENAPLSADILNPDAVQCFIRLTHDQYYQCLEPYFGTTIIGFFTDEPCVLGRNVTGYYEWSKGFLKVFQQTGGEIEELWDLFGGESNASTVLYRKLIKHRLNTIYYQQLSNWCEAHGIALMGHPGESDDIEEEAYFHIPGQDLVFRRVSPEYGGVTGNESVMAKCSADAARCMGRRRNANECFGVCARPEDPWYMTASDMKWFIDWLAIRGVNLFVPHAFYYSLEGERSQERPPDVGPGNIWWKYYRLFSQYMKRLSYLMTDSRNGARIAVLCESGNMPSDALKDYYRNQVEFNYVPIAMLSKEKIIGGKLVIGEYTYDSIYYENIVIPEDLEHLLKQIPRLTSGVAPKQRDFICKNVCEDLRVSHLYKADTSMYCVVNEGNELIKEEVSIPETKYLYRYQLWNGTVHRIHIQNAEGRSKFVVKLHPRESALFICSDQRYEYEEEVLETVVELTDQFQLVEEQINKKIYSLKCPTPRHSFQVYGEEMVECYVDDKWIGVSFWEPHIFQLPESNEATSEINIRLVVTGNIVNVHGEYKADFGLRRK